MTRAMAMAMQRVNSQGMSEGTYQWLYVEMMTENFGQIYIY